MNSLTNAFLGFNFGNFLGYYGLIEVYIYENNTQAPVQKFRDKTK